MFKYDQECHNHRPQTILWHREEETLKTDTHTTAHQKCNQLSLPPQDDGKTRKDTKQYITKQGPDIKHQITDYERTEADSVGVECEGCGGSWGGA